MIPAYYNEIDSYCCEWLRNLMAAGHIAAGDIDGRSIADVSADDLRAYGQCHFFAGIGVWSHALRLASVPDSRALWTGSCPCQPFSAAGKGAGIDDSRHLWPAWFDLIRKRRPAIILGEQVASKSALGWFDSVSDDLESEAYACAAADLCAPGVGAPHIRQRLFWVAYAHGIERQGGLAESAGSQFAAVAGSRVAGGLAYALQPGRAEGRAGAGNRQATGRGGSGGLGNAESERGRLADGSDRPAVPEFIRAGEACGLGVAARVGHGANGLEPFARRGQLATGSTGRACAGGLGDAAGIRRPARGHGSTGGDTSIKLERSGYDCDWIECTDGKWRPVEPGTFPLAHGVAGRVGKLRAYGNAIVAPLAAEFIKAAAACRP